MLKKYSVLLGIIVSISLLLIATMVYPGGSLFNKDSIGFDWSKNFISNLFGAKAVNGADNPSRVWADTGMIFLSVKRAQVNLLIRLSRCLPVCHDPFFVSNK